MKQIPLSIVLPLQKKEVVKKGLLLLVVLLPLHLFARILMTPWLQAVSMNSVWVLVECDSKDSVKVEYGEYGNLQGFAVTKLINATTSQPATFIHKIELSGLNPETRYSYKASQSGFSTGLYSFFTAVKPGTPFRMVWMADCRTNTSIFRKISKLMKKADPMVALYGGDLCMNGSYDSWKNEFFVPEQLGFASTVPFFNTPGNHEGWTTNTRAFTHNPEHLSGTQDYYSFDYGDVHILSVNTDISYDSASPQYRFIVSDLASTQKKWKIVISHEPAYCSGGHGENTALTRLAKEIFEPAKVDMVISGHSHFYQHNLVNGIHYFVPGSAGAPLYKPVRANYTVNQAKSYNFAVIDVAPKKIKIFVYNEKNDILEMTQLE